MDPMQDNSFPWWPKLLKQMLDDPKCNEIKIYPFLKREWGCETKNVKYPDRHHSDWDAYADLRGDDFVAEVKYWQGGNDYPTKIYGDIVKLFHHEPHLRKYVVILSIVKDKDRPDFNESTWEEDLEGAFGVMKDCGVEVVFGKAGHEANGGFWACAAILQVSKPVSVKP